MVIAIVCFVVAFASSVVTADLGGPERDLHSSEEVVLLSITLFVMGFGIGPMVSTLHYLWTVGSNVEGWHAGICTVE